MTRNQERERKNCMWFSDYIEQDKDFEIMVTNQLNKIEEKKEKYTKIF
jgi:hypothetical protein